MTIAVASTQKIKVDKAFFIKSDTHSQVFTVNSVFRSQNVCSVLHRKCDVEMSKSSLVMNNSKGDRRESAETESFTFKKYSNPNFLSM